MFLPLHCTQLIASNYSVNSTFHSISPLNLSQMVISPNAVPNAHDWANAFGIYSRILVGTTMLRRYRKGELP
jgi:hypothetical protein